MRGVGRSRLVVAVLVAACLASLSVGPGVAGAGQGDQPPPVLVVAHRGASKSAPEHTGAAYDQAVRAGADVLECDLQMTSDQQLVCLHDTTVDRTTGGTHTGRVDSYTLDQLRDMDFGSWFGPEFAGAKIVTLEEQIRCYRSIDPKLQFYVETKAPAEYGGRMEPALVDVLNRLDLIPAPLPDGSPDVRGSAVIVQSFDINSLATMRQIASSLPLAYLSAAAPDPGATSQVDLDVLAPQDQVVLSTAGLIDTAHADGREVHTWTVDDPTEMGTLIQDGIDGFFTNDPATARSVVDQAGRGSGRSERPIGAGAAGSSEKPAECPDGMGVGFTASPDARTEATGSTSTTAGSSTDAGTGTDTTRTASTDDSTLLTVLVILAVAAALATAVLVVISRRRRRSDDPDAADADGDAGDRPTPRDRS
jgi:glycerophosphoryl diester phosphodiesterase